jgi:hypothetical protein
MQATTTMSEYNNANKRAVPVGVQVVMTNTMAHLGHILAYNSNRTKMYIMRGYRSMRWHRNKDS